MGPTAGREAAGRSERLYDVARTVSPEAARAQSVSDELASLRVPGSDRSAELLSIMAERILVLDGAMGTMLQSQGLGPSDFGAPELEGCNEVLVRTRPDVVRAVHRAYLAAGADIIETDTFGGSPLSLAEYGLAHEARELNRLAAELALEEARAASTPAKPRFVGGSIGPTAKAISVTGGVTFAELVEAFREQVRGLLEGGVDLLFIETCQDTRNAKAALIAAEEAFAEAGQRRPVVVSVTIETSGTMLAGQTADAFLVSIEHVEPLAVGLNCATGPDLMTDHLRTIHERSPFAVSVYPNAGLPNADGSYPETPQSLAVALERFVDHGWLNIVGGCCGTTAKHIEAVAQMVEGRRPRPDQRSRPRRAAYSGIELVEPEQDNRPLLVGERTNVIGSRRFRQLIGAGEWDEAVEIARRQVRSGAQIIDVCLQSTEGDEKLAVREVYDRLGRAVRVPVMIDSTDPEAIELALTYCQGKAIVNSVNLEDGGARIGAVAPLLRRYGAAVIFGVIDDDPDQAQAFTRQRKLEIARRGHQLLVEEHGVGETDIIFDPLVFPAASGDETYIGAAVETIEGLRLIKEEFPNCPTVLGISNVSFGLPIRAREVVNSVFLYLCTKAGLDLAIVNTERIERYASIPANERQMAEALLANLPPRPDGESPLASLAAAPRDWRQQSPEQRLAIHQHHVRLLTEHFRSAPRPSRAAPRAEQTTDDLLAALIVDGSRSGLTEALDRKLADGASPLEIINGPLMAGMAEVGRLFNANELIVAEVLQSAEVMKAAVSHLEAHMEADTPATDAAAGSETGRGGAPGRATSRGGISRGGMHRGRVLLATVKGDVHDIGKNLVQIILANNGFEVIDLGIKVLPEVLVRSALQHQPDAIGLSGLLVKSAHQMAATAEDLAAAGVTVPLLVGGAALSRRFADERIAPAYGGGRVVYCADAMEGLEVLLRLAEGGWDQQRTGTVPGTPLIASSPARSRSQAPSDVRSIPPMPSASPAIVQPIPPPRSERVVWSPVPDLREIWSYMNEQMLYGKHLGLRGVVARLLAEGDLRAEKLQQTVEALKDEAEGWMRVRTVWRFYEAVPQGDAIALFEPGSETSACTFVFPRQDRSGGLCLADFVVRPVGGVRDSLALFVVSAGEGVGQRAQEAREAGEYLKSYAIQALAIETAEAGAEWLHARLRAEWGFPDPPEMTMSERFAGRYRGKRFSFGYPACPDLDDQATLWSLLRPEEIGVTLTEEMMMEPEASVSAIVFHHPDARYFSVE